MMMLAALGLAIAATATATPAQAEPVNHNWTWKTSYSHHNLGWGSYDKGSHTISVDDREQDGHSLYVLFDGPGFNNFQCWDTGGAVGPGGGCTVPKKLQGYAVDVYLCTGEWSSKDEIDCSGRKDYLYA